MIDADERKFGRDADNAAAGFKSVTVDADTGKVHDKAPQPDETENDTVRQMANELSAGRMGKPIATDTKIEFVDRDPEGPKAAFTLEQAADVVDATRKADIEQIDKRIEALRNQEIRDALDKNAGRPTDAERDAAIVAEDRRKADAARAHTELLQQVNQQIANHDAQVRAAQIDAAEQRIHGQRMAQLSAIANLAPELQNLSDMRQLPSAIAAIEQRSPQRAQALKAQINTLVQLNRQHAAVQNAKAQHANSQYEAWARQQDQAWIAKHGKDANFREIASSIGDVLQEHGIDPAEYVKLASTPQGAFLRSAQAQSLLFSMAKARGKAKSMADLQHKRAGAQVPPVVRPGTTGPGVMAPVTGAAREAQLNKIGKLTGDAQVRALAELLASKRRGGR